MQEQVRQITYRSACAAAVALAMSASGLAYAEADLESWSAMRGEVVNAEAVLGGDVSNGLNPVGNVTDLVLTPDGSQVQYILYEVPYPYSFFGAEDGFAAFDNVSFERGAGLDLDIRFDNEAAPQAPEELELTADQARERVVSRLLGDPMFFAGDEAREIEDILIDRDTGAVTHYVIETDPDSVFRTERRTVPAEEVTIDGQGRVMASMQLAALDEMQDYDPALL